MKSKFNNPEIFYGEGWTFVQRSTNYSDVDYPRTRNPKLN